MRMMDFREAKACLDEFSSGLSAISDTLKPNVAEGELGAVLEELNASLLIQLAALIKDSLILSTMVMEGLSETPERMVDFLEDYGEVLAARNRLDLAIAKANNVRKEFADMEKAHSEMVATRKLRLEYRSEMTLVEINFQKKYGRLYRYREKPSV
jgi:hypothetical protein